jgi:glutamine amidotransferase PdxT
VGTADQQTLGGLDILVRRNAFGRQVDSFEEDLRIRELGPEPVRAVFIRAPWVRNGGPGVEVLGGWSGTARHTPWPSGRARSWRPLSIPR